MDSPNGAKFDGTAKNTFLSDLLSWVIPIAFFFELWLFFIRRVADRQGFGGLMMVGKSKAKVYVERDTKVAFSDGRCAAQRRSVVQKSAQRDHKDEVYEQRQTQNEQLDSLLITLNNEVFGVIRIIRRSRS
jgi:hypothetical protein